MGKIYSAMFTSATIRKDSVGLKHLAECWPPINGTREQDDLEDGEKEEQKSRHPGVLNQDERVFAQMGQEVQISID